MRAPSSSAWIRCGRRSGAPAPPVARPLLVALLAALLSGNEARAQSFRYELGRRLIAVEAALEERSDPETLRAARPHLERATKLFFGLRFGEAGSELDRARLAIDGDGRTERLWASGLAVELERRLVDAAAGSVGLRVRAFHSAVQEIPRRALVRLRVARAASGGDGEVLESSLERLPLSARLRLGGVPSGDHRVSVEVVVDGTVAGSWEVGLSIAPEVDRRIAALGAEIERAPAAARKLEIETVRGLLEVLKALASGAEPETDYPAERLLREAEEMLRGLSEGKTWHGSTRTGQFWIRLPAGGRAVPARIEVPPRRDPEAPTPLVIALHGLGGSENLFFDGYGRGLTARLCRERGWLLVSPRSSPLGLPLGAIVEELSTVYPVDRRRVFVAGHSMGAQQALAAVESSPSSWCAAAALGGGWRVGDLERIQEVPLFLGVGTEDFAYGGVDRLRERLSAAGAKALTFRPYAGVEHIAVVQLALPDVFAFFDARCGG